MKKIFNTLLLFFISTKIVEAQQVQLPMDITAYRDSLNHVVSSSKVDTLKAEANFLLCDSWYKQDTVKAKKFLIDGKLLSKKNQLLNGMYFYFLANLTYNYSVPKAEYYYMQGFSALQNQHSPKANLYKAKIWHNYGIMQQLKDDNKQFADILLNKAIPYAQKSGDGVYLGKCFFDVGLTFKNMGQYEKVEKYCNMAIKILSQSKAPYDQIVAVYIMAAENYVLLNKLPQARIMLDKAVAILQHFPQSQYYADYYTSESMFYNAKKMYNKSLESVNNGLRLANNLGLSYSANRLLLQKYYANFGLKNYKEAKSILQYLLNQKSFQLGENKLQLYSGMAETHAGLGEMTDAFEWMKKYKLYSDSLYTDRLKSTINELELKYNQAENQRKITQLSLQKNQAELNSKNNRLLASVFSFLALLSSVILFFLWKTRKNEKKLAQQVEINYIQKIENLKNLKKLELSQAILEGEEHERKRLARELHDGLGSWLSGLRINFLSLKNKNTIEQNDFKIMDEQLDVTIKELRAISHNLLPETLVKLGLEKSLQDMCNQLSSEKLKIDLQTFGINKDLSENFQISIFRIIQELLNNAVKHAEATEVLVSCTQNTALFLITVEDNGKGFSKDTTEKGIGLKNIENRVQFLNGKIDIETGEKGTGIYIEFQDYQDQYLSKIG